MLAAAASSWPSLAMAQNTLPTREELSPAERTAPPSRAQTTGVVGTLDAGPCPFETSDLRFTLQSVEFAGLTAVPAERLAPAWSDLREREIAVGEICRIRDRAATLLLDEGFLARVEIPPQEIDGGRVRLQVVEARIATVTVSGGSAGARAKVAEYMKRLEGLAPFDLDVVQRQIMLASDIPGVRVQTNVRPSDQGQGAVDLHVQVSHDAVDALAAAQNYGSQQIGPWSMLARVDLNSLTGLGERTSLVVSASSDFDEQRVVQLLEEIRIGGSGLLARGSIAYAESRPGGSLDALGVEGESIVGAIEAAYPIIRDRRQNMWIAGGLEVVNQSTDVFAGAARLIDDKLRVAFLRLEGDGRATLGRMPALGAASVELRKGLGVFGASDAGEASLSRGAGDPQAFVLRANGRAEIALAPNVTFGSRVLLQWADEPLLAYEELSVGNFTIGRGYDPGAASGDRAAASALELAFGPFPAGGLQASLFGFYDSAWIENLDPGFGREERKLRSAGGGLRLNLTDRVRLDVTYAYPFDRPILGGPKADDRLLVNLVTRFW